MQTVVSFRSEIKQVIILLEASSLERVRICPFQDFVSFICQVLEVLVPHILITIRRILNQSELYELVPFIYEALRDDCLLKS